jgi:hypothetical protein
VLTEGIAALDDALDALDALDDMDGRRTYHPQIGRTSNRAFLILFQASGKFYSRLLGTLFISHSCVGRYICISSVLTGEIATADNGPAHRPLTGRTSNRAFLAPFHFVSICCLIVHAFSTLLRIPAGGKFCSRLLRSSHLIQSA